MVVETKVARLSCDKFSFYIPPPARLLSSPGVFFFKCVELTEYNLRHLSSLLDTMQRGRLRDGQTDTLAEISLGTVIDQVPDICYATPRELSLSPSLPPGPAWSLRASEVGI